MESDKITSTPSNEVNTGGQQKRALHERTTGPTRRSTKGKWTAEEDEILRKAVQCFKGKNWKKIAECFKDRTDVQCLHRWQKVLDPELVKGPWSKEEDELIVELVKKYGPKKWSMIAQHLPGRIGKQCRERWHNHLNPNINKQAWTQEEELALIRAHQIYGNKWAELTKFLPGRSDNAIKNHWNSSVKKKLNSYLASGLLAQFQGLPHVSHTNQSMPSSSSTVQSEDDSIPKDGTEAEEISECSQGSTVVGCSQLTSDMGNVVLHKREERRLTEECSHGMDPSFSSVTYSENYHLAFQEVALSAPVVPSESGDFSKFLEHSFSHDLGNEQLNSNELLNISSVEPGDESSEFFLPFQLQTSVGLSALLMGDMGLESDEPDYVLVSEDGCCRVIYPEPHTDGCSLAGNQTNCSNLLGFVGSTVSSLYQSSNYQIPEAADPPKSDMLRTSCSDPFSITSQLPANDGAIFCCHSSNPFNDLSHGNREEELVKHPYGGFGYTNDSINSLYDNGTHNLGQPDQAKDSSKLVSVDVFSSGQSSNIQTCSSVNDNPVVPNEQQDAGALFYEPPRFPSLDIPFFSCDLIQSGNDTQEEYSPLGIRRLMMSNMNCSTPIRLWSSPFRNDSPDAMLKSAAKTFTYTPSILKKRNRNLVSPMSEKRIEKKLDTDTNQDSFSALARNFSRVDVMYDDNGDKYKENLGHALELGKQEGGDSTLDNLIPEKELDSTNLPDKIKWGTCNVDAKWKGDSIVATTRHMQQPSGVLVEQNTNELLFFSPDRFKIKFDRSLGPGSRSLGNRSSRRLRNTWNQGAFSESLSGNPCSSSILSSPTISGKVDERRLVAAMSGNDAPVENLSLFGETPFKRSIESPSAWKSPWFMNSFVPGPRVDTDITIEDIGYFMSPGDRSYDAIGLMKQISEHTATAFAGAQVVLGDETPEIILKKRFSSNQKPDHNTKCVLKSPPENQSGLVSNILTEGRALDFSECGTPGKGKERGKFSSAKGFTSPSSYLLKSCR